MKRPAPLRVLYGAGWKFFEPVVLRTRPGRWRVLRDGASLATIGTYFPTFDEAIEHATKGTR